MTRAVSLQNLMDRSRRAADFEYDNGFVSDTELIDIINAAVPLLHDMLVSAYGEDYVRSTQTATLSGTTQDYALPEDFYKLIGVDVEINEGSNRFVPIGRYGERERSLGSGLPPMRPFWAGYRLSGRNLRFVPQPTAAIRYKLHYTPTAPRLIKAVFEPAAVDIATGHIALPDHGLFDNHPVRFTASASGTLLAPLVSSTTYWAQRVDANAISLLDAADGSAIVLTDAGTGDQTILSMFDGVNGWEELVVLEAAIAMLAKEESSTTGKERARDRMLARLEAMVDDRDSGEPEVVQDVYGGLDDYLLRCRWPPPL